MTAPRAVRSADPAPLAAALAEGAVLCTLVGIDGGFSRRVGAQLAVGADGTVTGSLADGCLEAELARQSLAARADGTAHTLRYGAGSPFIDFRLPCGAGVDIVIDPRPDRAALRHVLDRLAARQSAWLDVGRDKAGLTIEFIPRLRILALGAGPEVTALQRLAVSHGAELVPWVPVGGLAAAGSVPDLPVDRWTALAFLFHEHEWERALLPWGLASEAFLVGAIGGTKTRAQRLAMLAEQGVAPDRAARVRSPLGLIDKARDPATLALAVLAEIVRDYEAVIDRAPDAAADAAARPLPISHTS